MNIRKQRQMSKDMSASVSILPKRYSLPAFFLLAFGISWVVWVPAAAASWGLFSSPLSLASIGLIGAFGPSLAAIILTAVGEEASGLHPAARAAPGMARRRPVARVRAAFSGGHLARHHGPLRSVRRPGA